jgi:hypothetical protein
VVSPSSPLIHPNQSSQQRTDRCPGDEVKVTNSLEGATIILIGMGEAGTSVQVQLASKRYPQVLPLSRATTCTQHQIRAHLHASLVQDLLSWLLEDTKLAWGCRSFTTCILPLSYGASETQNHGRPQIPGPQEDSSVLPLGIQVN